MSLAVTGTDARPITQPECQGLVDRVAASVELHRAARLRSFLLYVCDQTLHHGIPLVHEQEIGEAVFGRPPGYDTSIDNIVRVNASELRKRLERYFAEEGAHEEILLDIPRGSYTPVFSRRSVIEPAPADPMPGEKLPPVLPVAAPAAMAEQAVATGTANRSLLVWQGAALLLLCACLGLLWQNRLLTSQLRPWRHDPALRAFWDIFFNPATETDILLADTSFALAEDMMQRTVSLSDYLDYSYKRLADAPALSADQRNDLRMVLDRNNGSIADFRVGQQVLALNFEAHRPTLKFAREYTPDAAKHHSLVLIGSRQSNPWVDLFAKDLNFDLRYDPVARHAFVVNRAPRVGEQATYAAPTGNDPGNTSYAVIAYVPDAIGKGNALILEGCDSQATGAAGDFVTSEDALAQLEQKFPTREIPRFEVLLRTSQLIGTPLHSEVIAYRVYPEPAPPAGKR